MDELRVASSELGGLLRYPDDTFRVRLSMALDVLEGDAHRAVVAFSEETANVLPEGLEELYTRTFDLNPVATLEVGWHLWGEQYERGRFLADLRGLQEELGVDAATELPDHLTILLPTLARMSNPTDLARKILPALEKIQQPLDEHGNPYRHLIRAATQILQSGDTALATRNSQLATVEGGARC